MPKVIYRPGERAALEKLRDETPAVVAVMKEAADKIEALYADPDIAKYSPLYSLNGDSDASMFRAMAHLQELRGQIAGETIKERDELAQRGAEE